MSVETGALLAHTHPLPSGTRARLRLPHRRDRARLLELLGESVDPLAARRIVCHDPTDRIVICATVVEGGRDHVVGVASAPRDAGALPDVVAVDPEFGSDLRELLRAAVADRARTRRRRRAA